MGNIAHASRDENKKYSGGTAGDQDKGEVCIRSWFSRPWTVMIRANDSVTREKIAYAMEAACKNDLIGYDQSQRNTLLSEAEKVGYDPSRVNVPCETDCSALVTLACIYAGTPKTSVFKWNNSSTTSTLQSNLESTGKFTIYKDPKYLTTEANLLRGDILLYPGHHVAVYISGSSGALTTPTSTSALIGIDVSSYQGVIDWKKVKESGINFAILKIIRKDLTPDTHFETNYNGCLNSGMPIKGFYNYSYATTIEKARSDAKAVVKIMRERNYPVWLDVEDNCQKNLGSKLIDIILTYKDTIEKSGMEFGGVYTGLSFYNSYIKPHLNGLNIPIWVARYKLQDTGTMDISQKPNIPNMVAWQFSSKGKVNGINGNVDMNVWYNSSTPTPISKPVSTFTETPITMLGRVTATNLNVRNKPDGDVIGSYPKGTHVALAAATSNGWYKTYSGSYVSAKYVEYLKGIVADCNSLYVRRTPDKTNTTNVIKGIPVGTQMLIMNHDKANGWYQVLLNDNTIGWCSDKYVKLL